MRTRPSTGGGRTRGGIAAIALLVFLLPGSAGASTSEETIFDAGIYLTQANSEQRDARLAQLKRLGTDTVRVILRWRDLVPQPDRSTQPPGFDATDPRDYVRSQWQAIDEIVRGSTQRGMRVLITPAGPIPHWASESGRSDVAAPKPGGFRDFITAVGRRYSGTFAPDELGNGVPCSLPLCGSLGLPLPRVSYWAVWNEPNLEEFLRPQFRHGRPYSPILYRRLFLAARSGLAASGHATDPVLIGETATSSGRSSIGPIAFLRGVFCLDRNYQPERSCRPLDAAGWAHHPYGYAYAPHLPPPIDDMVNMARIGRLVRALDRAAAAGATSGPLDVYVTEFGVLTVPRQFGVRLDKQVGWLAASEYLAWSNPRVASWAQYLLRDDSPRFISHFTSGLLFNDGRAKPAYGAFPITLLVRALRYGRVAIWGHVRPAVGPVQVTVEATEPGTGQFILRTIQTDARGYFSFASEARIGRRWRATSVLPGGRTLRGPFVRAYWFGERGRRASRIAIR